LISASSAARFAFFEITAAKALSQYLIGTSIFLMTGLKYFDENAIEICNFDNQDIRLIIIDTLAGVVSETARQGIIVLLFPILR